MDWELICFDLDNTIADYEQTFKRAIHHCFSIFIGDKLIPFDNWFWLFKKCCDDYWDDYESNKMTKVEYRRRRFLDTMDAFGLKADEKVADQFHAYFDDVVSKFVVPVQGMMPFLYHLQNVPAKLGIITNGKRKTQLEKIRFLGLSDVFPDNTVIVSDTVGVRKPDAAIFHYAQKNLAPYCDHKLFIGDSWEQDVVGAIEAEWKAIYFNTRGQGPTTDHDPLALCKNADELIKVVLSKMSS